jgi:endo-1,3(4)-beta-glucanase
MGVSQADIDQFGYASGTPAQYYISPIGVYSIIFSAAQFGSSTALTVDSDTAFSANINLKSGTSAVTFPVTQGMGFVTAIYQKADVRLQSSVTFLSLTFVKKMATTPAIYKYRIALNDGKIWLMYVTPSGSAGRPPFVLKNNTLITGPKGFNGIIQVSKNPVGTTAEATFDKSAGVYPTNTTLSGSTTGSSGTYSLSWAKGGITSRTLLMYALPHHMASFDSATSGALTNIQLRATTKGNATAVVADKFTMVENNLPVNYGFLPWQNNDPKTLTSSAYANIEAAAESELSQNLTAQCVLNSMYYSGKALAKFAQIVVVTNDVTKNSSLAAAGLTKLKQVFDVFVQNKQPYPLAYDTKFKGLISTAMFSTGNSLDDFGNGYYNEYVYQWTKG